MKISEKAIWFCLGMILPIAVGGIFMLKKQSDANKEPKEKYALVPDIEVEPPEIEPANPDTTTQPDSSDNNESAASTAPASEPKEAASTPPTSPLAPEKSSEASETVSTVPPKTAPQKDPTVPEPTADTPVVPEKVPEKKPELVKPVESPKPVLPPPTEYTLKSGDNPWLIAQKFDITTAELLKANENLNPKNLQIGQILKLPKNARAVSPEDAKKKVTPVKKTEEVPKEDVPADGTFDWYTIKSGENPWTIAKKLKVGHQDIMELNKELNFRDLKIGQKIKVPKKK